MRLLGPGLNGESFGLTRYADNGAITMMKRIVPSTFGDFKAGALRKRGPKPMRDRGSRWFRLYADVLTSPKVLRLDDHLFAAWIKLLTLASRTDGVLPSKPDCALWLRKSENDMSDIIDVLVERRFIDIMPDGELKIHDWDEFQYRHDTSTSRVQKHRARKANETKCNGNSSESESVSASVPNYPLSKDPAKKESEGLEVSDYAREGR